MDRQSFCVVSVQSAPDWQEILAHFRGSELQNYFTRILEDDLQATIKPQYVDHIPKAVRCVLLRPKCILTYRSRISASGEAGWIGVGTHSAIPVCVIFDKLLPLCAYFAASLWRTCRHTLFREWLGQFLCSEGRKCERAGGMWGTSSTRRTRGA